MTPSHWFVVREARLADVIHAPERGRVMPVAEAVDEERVAPGEWGNWQTFQETEDDYRNLGSLLYTQGEFAKGVASESCAVPGAACYGRSCLEQPGMSTMEGAILHLF
jgi:hypothetical protein